MKLGAHSHQTATTAKTLPPFTWEEADAVASDPPHPPATVCFQAAPDVRALIHDLGLMRLDRDRVLNGVLRLTLPAIVGRGADLLPGDHAALLATHETLRFPRRRPA